MLLDPTHGISSSLQSFGLFLAPLISGFMAANNAVYPLAVGGILIFITAFYYQFFFNKLFGKKIIPILKNNA